MSLTIAKALSKAISPLAGGITKELSGYLGDQIRILTSLGFDFMKACIREEKAPKAKKPRGASKRRPG
jgi:hypothetical protein